MRRRTFLVLAIAAALAAPCDLALTACRSPTDITVVVTTDFGCNDLHHATVSIGTLGDAFESAPATSTSTTCTGDGYAGSVVVIPSGSVDALVGIKVVGGFGTKNAEDCAPKTGSNPPDYGKGCIVARRALKYVAHKPLRVPIALRAACDGVPCGVTETCVRGACVPAAVDPNGCTRSGCDECTLVDGGCGAPAVYNDVTNLASWTTFDTTRVDVAANGFSSVAFDGRYLYFVPTHVSSGTGLVARYDTQACFDCTASWSTFPLKMVVGSTLYDGAAFDGRYVYVVPNSSLGASKDVARYDTQASFVDRASWSSFDLQTANAGTSFVGAGFDGRYLYLAPNLASIVARYDVHASFVDVASWSTFDTKTVDARDTGFNGAAFDGRYLYFAPIPGNVVARVDSHGAFGSAASWSAFDIMGIEPKAKGYKGATFDGRYVYFVPTDFTQSTVVVRYDTRAELGVAASWSTFDTSAITTMKGFRGALFDGRYVYLLPSFDSNDRVLARYDTMGTFASPAAWATLDTTTVNPNAKSFRGGAFDGRYVYLTPTTGGVVVRFDAKSPPSMPPGYSGSFF